MNMRVGIFGWWKSPYELKLGDDVVDTTKNMRQGIFGWWNSNFYSPTNMNSYSFSFVWLQYKIHIIMTFLKLLDYYIFWKNNIILIF